MSTSTNNDSPRTASSQASRQTRTGRFPHLRRDFAASLVVFLVALPLCVGVAVASGAPAELGLLTGIVGGLVTGMMRGSSLQVSGPAAGLTVLVSEALKQFGLPMLGALVLATGLLQILMGALRIGRYFRAISVSVVEGMLAGIGLVLIAGQLYPALATKAPGPGLAKLTGLPGAFVATLDNRSGLVSLTLCAGTVAVLVLWKRVPARIRVVPGPLVAVGLATSAAFALNLPVATVEVTGLLEAVQPPPLSAFGAFTGVSVLGTVLAFTLIASAESLFSAAAVDRLHDGPRTQYDRELIAQGAGNTVCGLLGALPMTAVIVRSAANVQAGARTKASRVLHGVWLLLFAALLPDALALIPVPALAGVLLHAGAKLVPVRSLAGLWGEQRGEALILVATAVSIVAVSMFEGVLIGLALSVAKAAWEASHVRLEVVDTGTGTTEARLSGNATFLRLPKILDALESLPQDRRVRLDLSGLHHLDHACRLALHHWAEHHGTAGAQPVRLTPPPARGTRQPTAAA
ncbi:SulP family inorganic anion transporter [Streptomyces sp. NPDC047028]|uniref:SulP family inorganic anion transporter n=1 Tax=Streptomyces sp. NPDC047028 TaxID=3155793 RepID=UPI00340CF78C